MPSLQGEVEIWNANYNGFDFVHNGYFASTSGVDEHFGDGSNSLFSWPYQLHAPHATNFNQPWFGMFNQYSTCLFISSVMTRPSIEHIVLNQQHLDFLSKELISLH
jgi:hypothetical protein